MHVCGAIVIPRKDGFLDTIYNLHLTCTKAAIGEFVVPQTVAAYVTTTANVPDNNMYLL
jgi:hypothetical protein